MAFLWVLFTNFLKLQDSIYTWAIYGIIYLKRNFWCHCSNENKFFINKYLFSRDLGDKCVEVSRCLAEIGGIKDQLAVKTEMLEKTQKIVDALRRDSDHMRAEIQKFDENVGSANRDYEVSSEFLRNLISLFYNLRFLQELILPDPSYYR